jgi:hypothetical protein
MAGIALDLKIEGLEQLKKMEYFLNPENLLKAERGGVSYAAKSVPPVVAKGIGASYFIKAARIKQDISSVRIDSNGTSASIKFSRRPPTLLQYGAKPGKRGRQAGLGRGMGWGPASPAGKPITATVLRSQGRKPQRGAFIATGNSGNQIVLRRDSAGKLHGVYGPSIGSIFLGKSQIAGQLQDAVKARINEQFMVGFNRTWTAAARGYGGKG